MTAERQRSYAIAGSIWLAVVCWLTLRSDPSMRELVLATPWYCGICGVGGATDLVLNLMLFVPFGLLARTARWPFRRLLIAAFLLTLSIELIQGNFLIGRDATLGDVLANSAGAVLGWMIAAASVTIRKAPRVARVAAIVILLGQVLLWVGTSVGLRPSLNGPPPWVGRFARVGNAQDPFEGTLQSVFLDGIPVTTEPLMRLPSHGDSLTLDVALTLTSRDAPPRSASIVRLVDATPRAFLRVSQVRQGINVEVQLRASEFRFRTPIWRFSKALDIPVGTPWVYQWRWHTTNVEMISGPAGSDIGANHSVRETSIGLGWSLLHPFVLVIDEHAVWWTVLWIAWWFALLGWVAAFGGRSFAATVAVAAIVAFTASGWFTALPVTLYELAAAVTGCLIGLSLAYATAPRSTEAERGASSGDSAIRTG